MTSRSSATLLFVCLCACSPKEAWYPPPVQYVYSSGAEPLLVGAFASMDDPFADNYIVSGVLQGTRGSPWRWANEKIELRFQLGELRPTRFVLDYVIPDSTFVLTGPVKVSVKLGDAVIATQKVDKPGEQHLSAPVQTSQLDLVKPIKAVIEVDKFYTSEHDGTKLGLMLQRAGFQQ